MNTQSATTLARARRAGSSLLALVLASATLAGCANEFETRRQIDMDTEKAAALGRVAHAPAPFQDVSSVKVMHDAVYIGANAKPLGNDRYLPPEWRGRRVSFVQSRSMDLREIANMITATTNMPVNYTAPTKGAGAARAPIDARRAALAPGQGPLPDNFNESDALGAASGASIEPDAAVPAGRMRINFSGTLAQFLDLVSGNFGVGWTSDGERIVFSSVQTKVYDVPALPLVLKLTNSFNSSGGSGASGSGSSNGSAGGQSQDQVSSTAAFEIWKDINATLKTILNGDGAVEVSGATGTVTVTGRPETIARVGSYIREINQRLAKEVVMTLTVYSIVLDRQDNYNFNADLALNKAGVAAAYANPGGAGAAAVTSAAGALSALTTASANAPTNAAGLGATITRGGVTAGGILNALSTSGNVSIVNSQSLTTVNGIPVPFQDVNTRGYLASVATTNAGTVGTTTTSTSIPLTTLTPGSVRTGFTLNMTPHVNNNGTVLMSYALDMSELNGPDDGFNTFTSGGNTIQLPNVNSRNFVQEATIPIGSTLVLSGIERTRTSSTLSGTGSIDTPLLGGGRDSNTSREILVVAITPQVIDLGSGRASR